MISSDLIPLQQKKLKSLEDFEKKIEFNKIRSLMAEECISELGLRNIENISFSSNYDEIETQLTETDEFKNILSENLDFPKEDYYNLVPELSRIRIKGSFIEQEELVYLNRSLSVINTCLKFFQKTEREEKFPVLSHLASGYVLDQSILKATNKIITEKGDIRSSASENLKKIRMQLASKTRSVDKKIGEVLVKVKKEGFITDKSNFTIRNGRNVLPVPVTFKRKIRGFIHDESATGQTVYIEPIEVFELNNEIRDLENAERREIVKILQAFTDEIRPKIDELIQLYDFLGKIDFIRAKARVAITLNAQKPQLEKTPCIDWKKAFHPLLFLSHQKVKKTVVPLDLSMINKERILIVSGPNAGGKSICLKTIGLLQYMIQSGLLIPVDQYSKVGIFENIFLDIGDEQSIENDLSTYTSHLFNLKHILENTSNWSLFLIDEFGSGTEPQLGGAIAESVLEKLHDIGAYGVITTHYGNLKLMADRYEGIINGAMLFDTKKMKPLYRLKTGRPGSSYAFEIARQIGFPPKILEKAADKTGISQLNFEQQLQQLELDKEEVDKKEKQLKVADNMLSDVLEKYNRLLEELNNKKADIIRKAEKDAKEILDNSNKLIEQTIKEIRENQANKEKTKAARNKLEAEKVKMDKHAVSDISKNKSEADKKTSKEIIFQKNDLVRIKGQNTAGKINKILRREAIVDFSSVKMKVALKNLEHTDEETSYTKPLRTMAYENQLNHLHDKMANFKLTIDVRGKRANDAISEIKRYIDDAMVLNIPQISILHGKGDGILRKVIREYLRDIPEIKKFGDEHIERGGDGITIINF